jgi:hypothetical protein
MTNLVGQRTQLSDLSTDGSISVHFGMEVLRGHLRKKFVQSVSDALRRLHDQVAAQDLPPNAVSPFPDLRSHRAPQREALSIPRERGCVHSRAVA